MTPSPFLYAIIPAMSHSKKGPRRVLVALWMGGESGRDILTGIFQYARTHRPWDIQLVQMPDGFNAGMVENTIASGIDGIISSQFGHKALDRLYNALDVPLVLIASPQKIRRANGGRISFVDCDNASIGEMGARHFLSHGGFNGFGFVGAADSCETLRERAFRTALAATGKPYRRLGLSPVRISADGDNDAMLRQWVKSLPKPAAVMAFYDPLALRVLDACRNLGLSVPGQVSVLGVDNDALLCDYSDPPLSSVHPNHERAGYMAAAELDALMSRQSRKPRQITCPVLRIVERESTRPIPPAAHLVRTAVAFIRREAANGIGVREVVAHLNVSRSLADMRFRGVLGRSIRQTIEDRRFEIAEKALRETSRSVAQISAACGYRNVKTFEAAFRRRRGMSPGEWRDRHFQQAAKAKARRSDD